MARNLMAEFCTWGSAYDFLRCPTRVASAQCNRLDQRNAKVQDSREATGGRNAFSFGSGEAALNNDPS